MRRIAILCISLFIATPAFAAKIHRDSKKNLDPKAKAAENDVKSACGCASKVAVDWKSFDATPADEAANYARNIGYEFENISKIAKEFCSDADSKKLFCKNVKTIKVGVKDDIDTKFNERSKTMEIHTTVQVNTGGAKMKSIMESW